MARQVLSNRTRRQRLIAYASVLPIFLYHFILIVLPTLNTLTASFTNWNGIGKKQFTGISNYIELVGDPNFITAFGNNIKWMIVFLTLPIMLGILLGYILSGVKKGRLFFRAVYFLPYVISAAIAGKIFAAFYNPYFGINVALKAFQLDFIALDWLAPKNALFSVAFVDMWHWWGFLLVIFISALQQIDPLLYESARVEGASELQKIWYITLPSIRQTIVFIVLITMVWSVSTFEYVWVMTRGGPGSEILSTMLYKNAYFKYRAGYASSIAVVQMLVSFLIFAGFGALRKRMED